MLYYEPLLVKADISRKDQAEQAVKKIIDEFSEINILVNSQGISQ